MFMYTSKVVLSHCRARVRSKWASLDASVVPLEARWAVFGGISGRHAQRLSARSTAHVCIVSSVVPKVPAEDTSATGALDWKMALDVRGSRVYPRAFCCR